MKWEESFHSQRWAAVNLLENTRRPTVTAKGLSTLSIDGIWARTYRQEGLCYFEAKRQRIAGEFPVRKEGVSFPAQEVLPLRLKDPCVVSVGLVGARLWGGAFL